MPQAKSSKSKTKKLTKMKACLLSSEYMESPRKLLNADKEYIWMI